MNKQLINKYKPEFDYFLNEGKILYKHIHSNAWWNEDPWNYSPSYITAIIINDEYSEFRKALAEGKVIEYLGQSSNLWHEVPEPDFNLHPTCYRIKPDEPKFKVGDFVRYIHASPNTLALQIDNINCERYHVVNSNLSFLEHELEPWTPVKNEWCWFYDNPDSRYSHLARFYDMHKSSANSVLTFMSKKGLAWYYCEPFLNSRPSYLKDK